MNKLLLVAVVLALSMAAASGVVAATATHNYNIPWSSTDWVKSYNAKYFQVDRFDPSLGALDSITLSLAGRFESCVQGDNTAGSGQGCLADCEIEGWMSLLGPDDASLVSLDMGGNHVLVDGIIPVPAGEIRAVDSGTYSGTGSYIAPSVYYPLFLGAGSVSLPVTMDTCFCGSAGGSTTIDVATQAAAGLSVTYSYTSAVVPEPASIVLGAMGLGSVAGLKKLRRA